MYKNVMIYPESSFLCKSRLQLAFAIQETNYARVSQMLKY